MINLKLEKTIHNFTLSAQIESKNNIGITGISGSGKSTLLNLISGIITADKGRIILNEKTVFDSDLKINVPIYKRKIAYVFQNYLLFPHKNITDNLKYACKNNNLFNEVVEVLMLDNLLNKFPNQISGGEKQRAAIGRAILSEPELILFDEPVNSLDIDTKEQVISFIKSSCSKFKLPIIYVSHDRSEIEKLCQSVIIINKEKTGDRFISTAYLKD